MAVRVTCINKDNGNHDNPHEAIHTFGWLNEQTGKTGKASLQEMVDYIDGGGRAFVRSNYSEVDCYTRRGKYRKFVQTYSDNTPTDNLLWLPECV